MQKAISYLRVSSKKQEQEGFSIPAQRKLLLDFAKAHGFSVVKEFEDDETAKSAGRECRTNGGTNGDMTHYFLMTFWSAR